MIDMVQFPRWSWRFTNWNFATLIAEPNVKVKNRLSALGKLPHLHIFLNCNKLGKISKYQGRKRTIFHFTKKINKTVFLSKSWPSRLASAKARFSSVIPLWLLFLFQKWHNWIFRMCKVQGWDSKLFLGFYMAWLSELHVKVKLQMHF